MEGCGLWRRGTPPHTHPHHQQGAGHNPAGSGSTLSCGGDNRGGPPCLCVWDSFETVRGREVTNTAPRFASTRFFLRHQGHRAYRCGHAGGVTSRSRRDLGTISARSWRALGALSARSGIPDLETFCAPAGGAREGALGSIRRFKGAHGAPFPRHGTLLAPMVPYGSTGTPGASLVRVFWSNGTPRGAGRHGRALARSERREGRLGRL